MRFGALAHYMRLPAAGALPLAQQTVHLKRDVITITMHTSLSTTAQQQAGLSASADVQARRSASPFGFSVREADPRLFAAPGVGPGLLAERFGDCSPGPAYECVTAPTIASTP